MELILLNAAVGAAATLLRFFLQARLTEKGLPDAMLGPALFFMGLGGAAGARLILHCKSCHCFIYTCETKQKDIPTDSAQQTNQSLH